MSFFSFDDDSLQKHEKKLENEKPFSRPSRVYKVKYIIFYDFLRFFLEIFSRKCKQ